VPQPSEADPDWADKPDDLRSIYGVFVNEKAVCAGYAVAFQYLMNRLGIECTYVIGPTNSGGWHAWNLIKLEGDYYYVDVTFDDRTNTDMRKSGSSEISYDYFCITTDELCRSRSVDHSERYPQCTASKCNYFIRSKLFLKEYDAARITKGIHSFLKAGKKEVFFKMPDAKVLALVKKRLIEDRGINDILNSFDGEERPKTYFYYSNEELHILHIIIETDK